MSLQNQVCCLSDLATPAMVKFVLSGRKNLSEHFPIENIDVAYKIAERSPYLRNFLPRHTSSDRPLLPILLGDIDPAGFTLYIEWLTTGHITAPIQKPLLLESCVDLIYAHIVGAAFCTPHFQDYIIDTMTHTLDIAQGPDLRVLEILFLEKHASSHLKRFVIDRMFAQERKMVGMLRNDVEDMVTGRGDVKGCEYHVHEEGMCYRQGRVATGSEETEIEKNWSADDDAELNATAAYYLKSADRATPIGKKILKRLQTLSKPKVTQHQTYMEERQIEAQSTGSRPKISQSGAPNVQYNASAVWSHQLHGSKSFSLPALSHQKLNKPLPPTPPPCPSPPLPFSFTSSPASAYEPIQGTSTQDLVHECLARLSPTTGSPSVRVVSDEGVATKNVGEESDSSTARSVNAEEYRDDDQNLPTILKPGSPQPTNLFRDFSFSFLPRPRTNTSSSPSLTNQSELGKLGALYAKCQPPTSRNSNFVPAEALSHHPRIIPRKPAPPRGHDWIEQWDRLHALRGTQGFGLRKIGKGEKKSRFLEILGTVKG